MSSVIPGHPLIGRSKGGQGGKVFRVRMVLCSCQDIDVVVAVEEGDRRPSFGRWTRQTLNPFLFMKFFSQDCHFTQFMFATNVFFSLISFSS